MEDSELFECPHCNEDGMVLLSGQQEAEDLYLTQHRSAFTKDGEFYKKCTTCCGSHKVRFNSAGKIQGRPTGCAVVPRKDD